MGRALMPLEERHRIVSEALEGIADGDSLTQCAERAGVTPNVIRAWLLSDVPDQYRAMQERGLIQRVLDCDDGLEQSTSHLEVAKRAHMAKFARWDAERRLPRLFASKTEVTGPGGGPIQIEPTEVARRLAFLMAMGQAVTVEGESTRETDADGSATGSGPALGQGEEPS